MKIVGSEKYRGEEMWRSESKEIVATWYYWYYIIIFFWGLKRKIRKKITKYGMIGMHTAMHTAHTHQNIQHQR